MIRLGDSRWHFVAGFAGLVFNTYRFIRDVQGSVRLVVDTATGAIAQRMGYDSFVNVLLDTNPGFQPYYCRNAGMVGGRGQARPRASAEPC